MSILFRNFKFGLYALLVFVALPCSGQNLKTNSDSVPKNSETNANIARKKILELPYKTDLSIGLPKNSSCLSEWRKIEKFPSSFEKFKAVGDKIIDLMPQITKCQNDIDALKIRHEAVAGFCGPFIKKSTTDSSTNQENFQNCISSILLYRAALHDYVTRNSDDEHLDDRKLLFEKLTTAFMTSNGKNFNRAEKLALRLSKLEPELFEPKKVIAISKFMASMSDSKKNSSHAKDAMKAVRDALSSNRNDVDLEAMLFLLEKDQTSGPENFANQKISENPMLSFPYYSLAQESYARGDVRSARGFLQKAIQIRPDSSWYRSTLDTINADKLDPGAFSLQLNVFFNLMAY